MDYEEEDDANNNNNKEVILNMARSLPAMLYVYEVRHDTGESSFSYVSDYCKEMFGFTASQVMADPKRLVNAVLEEEAEGYAAAVMESMEKLTPFDRQIRMRRANGQIFHAHCKSMPRVVQKKDNKDNNNNNNNVATFTVWDGIVFDVTKQVTSRNSNRTAVQEIIDDCSLECPMFEIDMSGNVTEWNRRMAETTGYSRLEALGQAIVSFIAKEDRGSFATAADKATTTTTNQQREEEGSNHRRHHHQSSSEEWECAFLSKAGDSEKKKKKKIYFRMRCTKMRDDNHGQQQQQQQQDDDDDDCYSGILYCCQDITSVKEAEQQKDAALKLVDAERGLTEWLSHEVRNPLSVAMEAANTLKEGGGGGGGSHHVVDNNNKDEDDNSCVDLIAESIHYVVDLLNNMLDLNKCLDGKITLDPQPCKLWEEILIPTWRMMGVRSSKVQLRLAASDNDRDDDDDDDDAEVVATVDKLRLRQVVTNLVANSLKFTSEGFVEIALRRRESDIRSCYWKERVVISVRDSGCGIRPSDHNALFSKWEQLGSQINGTGIGLCLCQALVRAMGGEISLNKDYHSGIQGHPGAEFLVELPMVSMSAANGVIPRLSAFDSLSAAVVASRETKQADFSDDAVQNQNDKQKRLPADTSRRENDTMASSSTRDACVRGRFHILVVDDEKVGRKLLTRRFGRLFPEAMITELPSGEDALCATAEDVCYDIITMDHFMAVDEMNGDETIRALRERNVDALIVGISGNAKEKEHLEAGAEAFFQKPLPSDEAILNRLITKMSPPSGWKVLCIDDVDMNVHFLCRKLNKVAAPHFTTMKEAEKRWNISSRSSGEAAIDLLSRERFDIVVLDHHLQDGGLTGTDVATFLRENAKNKDAIVVLNTGSISQHSHCNKEGPAAFDILWPKPLPSIEQMRLDLCRALLRPRNYGSKRPTSRAAESSSQQ